MSTPLRIFDGRFGRLVLAESRASDEPAASPVPVIAMKYDGGEGFYVVGGESLPLTREDLVLVNSPEPHAALPAAGSRGMRLILLHASPAWLADSFPAIFAEGTQPFPQARELVTSRIRRLADTLAVEALNDQFLSAERLEFMLQELLLSIVDAYLARKRAASRLWRGSRFADSRIRQALALLRERPHKDTEMEDLAHAVGLSRSRFYELFQRTTGRAPRAYLDLLCVETAIARLSLDGSRIGEVSAELGFSAQSNFTRFFLNQVGIAPSEYRRASARPRGQDSGEG
jgi:AraC-like DNA-binding protein